MRHLGVVMSKSLNMFRMFKDRKEMEATMSFADQSVDLMKKLSKVSLVSIPAKIGARAIEKIFLGDKKNFGLLGVFRKLDIHKKEIHRGKKTMKDVLNTCGSMLLTTMALTGIAALAIPAMVGTLLMKGVIWLMAGTFTLLSKLRKPIKKGSATMLLMSTSVITFSLGLILMTKAVKDMKLKDVGLMVASLAGIGLTVAGIGLLAAPIALGSASLLLMGASLGVFGLAVSYWKTIDTKKAVGNIKEAIGGLREAFGIELGKNEGKKNVFQRLGGGIMGIAMGLLNFGQTFFMMGTLLMAGVSLGLLYHGMKKWDRFDGKKAATNIKTGVGALKEAFDIEDNRSQVKGGLKKIGGGILDMGLALLQGGSALVKMGVITVATAMADIIRVTLIPWNRYDAKPAAKNLKVAVDSLKEVFGLEENNDKILGKGIRLVGGLLDMGTTLMNSVGVLAKIGTITIATGMAAVIKKGLEPWENYNAQSAVTNMGNAVGSLVSLFGLDSNNDNIGRKGLRLFGSLFDMGSTLMNAGGVLAKMGTITLATGMLSKIQENLKIWENYDSAKPIRNIKIAVDNLLNTFGLSGMKNALDEQNKNTIQLLGDVVRGAVKTVTGAIDTAKSAMEGTAALAKISSLSVITSVLKSIKESIEPWGDFDTAPALKNIKDTVSTLTNQIYYTMVFGEKGAFKTAHSNIKSILGYTEILKDVKENVYTWGSGDPTTPLTNIRKTLESLTSQIYRIHKLDTTSGRHESMFRYFKRSAGRIKDSLYSITEGFQKSATLRSAIPPFKKTVDIVNSVNMEKASVLVDLFKSFSDIKKKPFDKFTESVNKFAESSNNLIDALNNFSENYNVSEGSGEEGGTMGVNGKVSITNSQDLAEAFAAAIKALPINVHSNISDVKLVVDGQAGRKVVLTLDN